MSLSFLKTKCCPDNNSEVLENSLHKLSYQGLISLKSSPELNVVSIEAKKVQYFIMVLLLLFTFAFECTLLMYFLLKVVCL